MASTLEVILRMQLAFEESAKKSARVGQVWAEKRKQAANGEKMGTRRPSWLDWDKKENKFIPNKGVKAIEFIFNRTCEGCGQKQLTHELNEKFNPIGHSKKWNGSYITKILNDRAVLGELQPMSGISGVRVNSGKPIIDYYPRIVSDDLWYRATASKTSRKKAKGRNGNFVNLFVGLVFGIDAHPCHVYTARGPKPVKETTRRYVQRRIVSYGHLLGLPDACHISFDYYKFEEMVVKLLHEIKADDLLGKPAKTNLHSLIAEIAGIEERIAEIAEQIPLLKKPLPALIEGMAQLEARKDDLEAQCEAIKSTKAITKSSPLIQAKDCLSLLAELPTEKQHETRLKLRGIIAQLVSRINIEMFKASNRRVGAVVEVIMQSGKPYRLVSSGKQGAFAALDKFTNSLKSGKSDEVPTTCLIMQE
jgi:hypothetical protein